MKIRADEHVSRRILQAVRLLCLQSTSELSHVRDDHPENTHDETWLFEFAEQGGQAFLTGDANILKKPHQIVAVKTSGLIGLILSKQWTGARLNEQAANILFWWPRIEKALHTSLPGDCWPIPFQFDHSELQLKKIDYESAAKAVR